ncbi:MAG: phosphoribosylamine--glycine ligase [Chloroflexota bacterium]
MDNAKVNILLLGAGGREHALAWKLSQSPRLKKLFCMQGNPGTADFGMNIPGDVDDAEEILIAAKKHEIDFVVIGPESPLAAGVSDELRKNGYLVFGPSQAAAQLESSKVFSKVFMQRHEIPTAQFVVVDDHSSALEYIQTVSYQYVIKVSGLAAGKGVFLPEDHDQAVAVLDLIFNKNKFGDAGTQVVIEERLFGREVSLLAFTDGKKLLSMPPAQDHKRLLDNDQGPNTGGMGVFAPSPYCPPEMAADLTEAFIAPALRGMASEGTPYSGVLYAGVIMTEEGPRLLEYNCRFGDPETQVILPLLNGDLVEILLACEAGELDQIKDSVGWNEKYAVCVVLASEGYPEEYRKGDPITGLELVSDGWAFHAGTAFGNKQVVTNGGRVLGITALGSELNDAARNANGQLEKIKFPGMQYRTDIAKTPSNYASSGVSIDEGNRAADLIKKSVSSTYNSRVLSEVGSFGGLFDISSLSTLSNPVLVASTDGVGTKVILASKAGSYQSIGHDIVNHCINDILVQGAFPLFFLDYYASSKLVSEHLAEIVTGISAACRSAGIALLGGETAEMPGVYRQDQFDLAGTIVGVVEKGKILPRSGIEAGDLLVGIASDGPHTNGFSLIRSIFEGYPVNNRLKNSGLTILEALLTPHRSYLGLLQPLLTKPHNPVKALAHITGGGHIDNIPRVLPAGYGINLDMRSWEVPEIFKLIQSVGNIDKPEMYRVFNMGIGMVVIVDKDQVEALQSSITEETWIIGQVTGIPGVKLV